MDIGLIEEAEYTPEWNGNRDEVEPIVATLAATTATQRTRFTRVSFDEAGRGTSTPDYAEAVRVGVKQIRNLNVGGKPVADGQQLLVSTGRGLQHLIVELGGQVIRRSFTPDLKN